MSSNPFYSPRIVSLVPSLTHTLCEFGLQPQIVGCTSFCSHPASLRHTAVSVGGTKDPVLEKITALQPTHILVNHEENVASFIQELHSLSKQYHWKIVETHPITVSDSIEMVVELGSIFGFKPNALDWAAKAKNELEACLSLAQKRSLRYAYFIWREPWMVAGNQTYIAEMLKSVGLINVIETSLNPHERYPALLPTDPRLSTADVFLFSSEPYAFKNRHIEEFLNLSKSHVDSRKIDGQMLSWFGALTLEGLQYLRRFSNALAPHSS